MNPSCNNCGRPLTGATGYVLAGGRDRARWFHDECRFDLRPHVFAQLRTARLRRPLHRVAIQVIGRALGRPERRPRRRPLKAGPPATQVPARFAPADYWPEWMAR